MQNLREGGGTGGDGTGVNTWEREVLGSAHGGPSPAVRLCPWLAGQPRPLSVLWLSP